MELKLENGRYVPAPDGYPATVAGVYELAQRITMKLAARRGAFAPMPNYGSRLYTLPKLPPAARPAALRRFIAEALADESGVTLQSADIAGDNGTMRLTLRFSANAAELTVELGMEEA